MKEWRAEVGNTESLKPPSKVRSRRCLGREEEPIDRYPVSGTPIFPRRVLVPVGCKAMCRGYKNTR